LGVRFVMSDIRGSAPPSGIRRKGDLSFIRIKKGLLHNGPRKKTVSKTLRMGSLLTVFVVRCSC